MDEIMAREIKATPKLDLEDTKEFLEINSLKYKKLILFD